MLPITLFFGVVTISLMEMLRRQYVLAYGVETHNSYGFFCLLSLLFVTAYVAYET